MCFYLYWHLPECKLIFLPSYSPDLNLIKQAFSSIKAFLHHLLQYCVWTAAMFFFFTSCFTISSLHCLSSLCMTPEDDMWSSITWLTVWATCQQHVSMHVSRLLNYCTITLCLHTDLTAMSAHAWEASWYVFELDHRLHNRPTQTHTIWYSHCLAITVLLFTYSYFY